MKILEESVNEIINSLNIIIEKKIVEVKESEELDDYDVKYIKGNLDEDSQNYFDDILEEILNYYLDGIEKLKVNKYFELVRDVYVKPQYEYLSEPYKSAAFLIDDVLDYADTFGKYDGVHQEAGFIASDLIRKKIGLSENVLDEPVRIKYLKYYCISYKTLHEDIYNEIWYIILYLAIHYHVLKEMKV